MVTGVLYQTSKKITTRLKLPLHITWDGRRYHLVGDITHLAGMPSSLTEEERGSLEWSSIPRTSGRVILHKREEKNQNKTSAQKNYREAQKVWRILLY